MYRFGAHAKTVVDRVEKRNNVLCALAGSSWGKDKELLLTTYKATGRAIINYAAPVWSPVLADSHWQKIQRCRNPALRSATGCTRMTMEDNLQNETKILPVRDHCQLLSAKHLLASQSTHHPNHGIKDSVSERDLRKTLTEEFGRDVESATERSHPKWLELGNIILHNKFVRKSISKMRNNKVQNAPPHPISESEKKLLRSTRVKLAQLRSGYSKLLISYMSTINPEVRDVCPDCQESPHDTNHLFECKNKPTHLTIDSLWLMPVEAASFLGL